MTAPLPKIFLEEAGSRTGVVSLTPHLLSPPATAIRMDPKVMKDFEIPRCRWIGCAIGKGITSVSLGVSVFGSYEEAHSGLHGVLAQGFPEVDPVPLCYDPVKSEKGFGTFIRWIFFRDAAASRSFWGIDFSLIQPRNSGVAVSMLQIADLARVGFAHGIPGETELVLLNWRMCEEPFHEEIRKQHGLITVSDWAEGGYQVFGEGVGNCPRCGLTTFFAGDRFCRRCGCDPRLCRSAVV